MKLTGNLNRFNLNYYLSCIAEIASRLNCSSKDVYNKYGDIVLKYCNNNPLMVYTNLIDIIMKELTE